MTKLTVQQYANKFEKSVQQVYRQIKKGSLTSVKENGKTFVVVDDTAISQTINNDKPNEQDLFINHLLNDNKQLKKQLKIKDKEIKRLTKELLKVTKTKEDLYEKVIGYTLEYKPNTNIDIKEVKGNKKKKRKSKP